MDPMKHLSAFLYGLVPTSTLLCSADGDPPGEGGGQAPQQPPPAPAQPASPPQFTPDQMAWIEAEKTRASNAAAAAARKAEQARLGRRGGDEQPAQSPAPSNPPQPNGAAQDPAQVYMRLRTFDRAVDKYELPPSARDIIEADFNKASPQDPAEWVQQRAEAFGWKARGSNPATPAPETPAAKTPQGPPVTGSGAPANPTTVTEDTPILRMSETDRVALMRRIGNAAYVERFRKELREGNVRVRFNRG